MGLWDHTRGQFMDAVFNEVMRMVVMKGSGFMDIRQYFFW